MTDAFLVRTEPDSSMVNPAHIHMISAPHTRNAKVLSTKSICEAASARATGARKISAAVAAIPASIHRQERAILLLLIDQFSKNKGGIKIPPKD